MRKEKRKRFKKTGKKTRLDDNSYDERTNIKEVPIEILRRGSKATIEFLLDLFRSPKESPLYRTKLITVGYAEVGKTSTIDALFSISSWTKMKKGDRPIKELWIEMKGRYISCYNSPKRERKIDVLPTSAYPTVINFVL